MQDFNPLRFAGRIGRLQYFGFAVIWYIILFIVMMAFSATVGVGPDPTASELSPGAGLGWLGLSVLYMIATVSYGVRRLHDFDKSGWWYLLSLVPLVNFVFALILLFAPGTAGANRYGVRGA